MTEQKILNYYFGNESNDLETKTKLAELSCELFQNVELYQEELDKMEKMKQDPVIKVYLKCCAMRMNIFQKINMKKSEDEKKTLIEQANFYTKEISRLAQEKKAYQKIKEYNDLQMKCSFFQQNLNNRIGKDFEELNQKYRQVYVVDEIKKSEQEMIYISHEVFSRKKLILHTEDPFGASVDTSALFWLRNLKEDTIFERRWLYMEEPIHFNSYPELWFAENKTAFKENEGELTLKKHLFPKQ